MDVLLMKVPEAAAALGVSRAKLYELIACGALPAVKVDGFAGCEPRIWCPMSTG